jgi:hypothetical protein
LCLFTHVAAGAIAGAYAPNLFLAPVFGLGSHIALDMIPHHDFENMAVEIILAVVAIGILLIGGAVGSAVLLGIIFGILPDLENLLWKLGIIRDEQKIFPGHVGILRHGVETGVASIYLQAVLTIAAVLVLIWGNV